MNILVVSFGKPGTVCKIGDSESTFDSHGKARVRLPKGKYTVQYNGQYREFTMPNKTASLGQLLLGRRPVLNEEDKQYLEWLEMPHDEQIQSIENEDPISRWAPVIGVR